MRLVAAATSIFLASPAYLAAEGPLDRGGLQVPYLNDVASEAQSPYAGEVFFDLTDSKFYGYNGSAWLDFSESSTITTQYDLVIGDASGNATRLPKSGTNNRVLVTNGSGVVQYDQIDDNAYFASGAEADSSNRGVVPSFVDWTSYSPTVDSYPTTGYVTSTPVAQVAKYARIGNIVHVRLHIDTITLSTSSALSVTLPETAADKVYTSSWAKSSGTDVVGRYETGTSSNLLIISDSIGGSTFGSGPNTEVSISFSYEKD